MVPLTSLLVLYDANGITLPLDMLHFISIVLNVMVPLMIL